MSRRSGVPVPTIKFYLREGLLPPGTLTAANQADYTEAHLRRLRLVRALVDVGGVSVAGAREVVGALADDRLAGDEAGLLGAAQHAIMPRRHPDRGASEWKAARERVVALIEARKWRVDTRATAVDLIADTLAASMTLGGSGLADLLPDYADAAAALAATEVAAVLGRTDPAERMEAVVVGTVLGERVFSGLRMLAHQHESSRRLGSG